MILPIINQECIVFHNKQATLGRVSKAYTNHLGQWRIAVWSHSWGYDRDFKACDVSLVYVSLAAGEAYNAEATYRNTFTFTEQKAHFDADNVPEINNAATTTRRVSATVEQKSNTPKEGMPARLVRRVRSPG